MVKGSKAMLVSMSRAAMLASAGMRTGAGEGRYRDGWLKLFADGALGSRSAALLAPWEPDDPAGTPLGDPTGLLTADQDDLMTLAVQATAHGIAVQIQRNLAPGQPRLNRIGHRGPDDRVYCRFE